MAKGISIGIASETREYAQGIAKGVIEPTEEAQQALDKLGGNDAGEQLQAGMRDAQHATEQTRADIAQLSSQVRETGRAGRSSGSQFKAGMHEADEGVKQLKENTAQNLKEIGASFDGTTTGALSGVQGLVAEFLEGFGPGGLVAGVVGAGALGILLTQLEANDQATEQFKADVQALAQQWIEAGKEGKLSSQEIADGLKALATQTDTTKASLSDVEKQAKTLGVPFAELAQVYAQGGDAVQYAIDKTERLLEAERQQALHRVEAAGQTATLLNIENARTRALEGQLGKLRGVQHETTEAAKREQEWLKAGGPALERKAAATANYATSVQDALKSAGSSWDDYATKEGGLSLAKYIKVTEDKIKAVHDYQANLGALANAGNQAALDYVESLGVDAAPLLAKFVHAPEAQRAELVDIWARLGHDASSSYNSALQDGLPDSYAPPALLPVDSKEYLASIKRAHQEAQAYLKAHPLQGGAVAYTSNGKPIYQ